MFNFNNKVVQEDLQMMADMPYAWHVLKDKTVLVTGATGMLATYITYLLCYLRNERSIGLKVVALCRTKSKADTLFMPFIGEEWFTLLLQDICEPINYNGSIDYIFHLAGNASPYFIKHDPVGIMKSNLIGTMNVLELARNKLIGKIVFASTREVYGKNEGIEFLNENDYGFVNPMEDRACYPESKRAAETMLRSYYLQYGIPFCSVRIAHSYGPGMKLKDDGRVLADLMGNIVNGEDIVLKSDGTAERAFCYITDAVIAMFLVLLGGKAGEAYNVANEAEPISIRDLAQMLINLRTDKKLTLVFDIPQMAASEYCNYKRSGLDTSAIEALGWKPQVRLNEGLKRTMKSFII